MCLLLLLSVVFGVVCPGTLISSIMSKSSSKTKHLGESRSHYKLCVPPCKRYITAGDIHSLCVVCMGASHAESSPAGSPLQGTELAALSTLKASLERLVPLVDYLAEWKLLPNVSQWVLHTVERGYRIQIGSPPPRFNIVIANLVGPEQALVMELEVDTLLRKEAIEVVPPHVRESGFYSRYFIVPKKEGGLRLILDLRQLNRSVMRLKFKMLMLKQVVSQIRSEDWFVTIDLKDAYFHVFILPTHKKFLRFAFRGKAYQFRVLPFGLALSPRTFTKCVDAALAPL